MISWDTTNVNTKVRRNGFSWGETEGFIEDKTRSGKTKRRISSSNEKRPFDVKFIFNITEYNNFTYWYNVTCRKGFETFMFPKLDAIGGNQIGYYRIAKGGAPKYTNTSGDNITCTMKWEEVENE